MPGYEHRPGQLTMAEAVEDALARERVLLVEAGTGTGKTLAYLLPAVLSGRRVVVSTGTRALQDQLMGHDVPLLEQLVDAPVSVACLKGLGNYLCLRRFEELRRSGASTERSIARRLPLLERWRGRTESGDRSELGELAEEDPLWSQVASGSDTRIGPRCTYYDECFVTAARRRAEEAQLVVVNHHLFFADLAMRGPHGAGVLPDYDIVVFDEAHQLEDVATQFFGVQVSTTRLERLVRDAERILAATRGASPADAAALASSLRRASQAFFVALPRPPADSGRTPLEPDVFTGELGRSMLALDSALEAVAAHAQARVAESESLAQLARRAQQIRDDVARVAEGSDRRRIAWTQARGRLVSIGSSPVDVSEVLREELFFRVRGAVLTSATLSTGGRFDFVRRRLGLDFDVPERVVPSPFDFARQAVLYLPAGLADPRAPAFAAAAAEQVRELVQVTNGGAFVLCTSVRMMRELAARGRADLTHPVLMQGDAPKASLLARFRELGDAVLYATASFWEGVDVPGEALRLVVIDKLPFDVPTDPLVVARCERLREEGESPFMKYLLPAAALSLKQGFGRLVRTTRDRGIVAILDSRIVTKGYGKVLLRSLPPAARCSTLDEVRAWWTG